jgi:hypothetical protein
MVGAESTMRVLSFTTPFLTGTFRSARTNTLLPLRGTCGGVRGLIEHGSARTSDKQQAGDARCDAGAVADSWCGRGDGLVVPQGHSAIHHNDLVIYKFYWLCVINV